MPVYKRRPVKRRPPKLRCTTCKKRIKLGAYCADCVNNRICVKCGEPFTGTTIDCDSCGETACITCGKKARGLVGNCDSCIAAQKVESKLNEVIRGKVWNSNLRAAKFGVMSDVTFDQIKEIFTSGNCAYCGGKTTEIDHVWPMSRGGSNTADNIVPVCFPCNDNKRSRLLTEWWRIDRVHYGIEHSYKVAREWERLVA